MTERRFQVNEIEKLVASLSDAIAAATVHSRRDGADDEFRGQLQTCRKALKALSQALRVNEPHSSKVFAGVEQTMKRFIDELETLVPAEPVRKASTRSAIPLKPGGLMVWRQATGDNAWHFTDRCSRWPTELFAERATRPNTGHLCDECISAWRTTWLGAATRRPSDDVCCRAPNGAPLECRP